MVKKAWFFSVICLVAIGLAGCNKEKAHSHSYDFNSPQWTWEANESGAGYTAKVKLSCTGCEETNKGHFAVVDAVVSSTNVNPTCENDGSITYTATATYNGQTLTDSKTDSIDKLGHIFDTMTVEGNYRKTYSALESFDSSTLTVKIHCSRDGCGTVKTLTQEEYFVIYETQGIDHFNAGDTRVTISANYAPFAKYEINDLTVSKIANAITGMENSYVTGCRHAPDLSGVTALSGTLEYGYYLDSGCTQEITVDDLVLGTYYLKATANGGENYETISQVASLTVTHTVEQCVHYERIEPTLYKPGCLEYWLCEGCGTAFKNESLTEVYPNNSDPSDPLDERYIAPVGEETSTTFIGDSFLNANATISSEPAPTGYAFNNVYELANANIRTIFNNIAVVDGFSKIAFAVKTTEKWFSCRGDWAWSNGTWKVFELVKNDDDSWNIYGATAGNPLTLKHENVSQRILSADDNDTSKSILAFTCDFDTCYVTNLRVIREAKLESIEKGHLGTGVTLSAEPTPVGYDFTNVYQIENANIRNIFNTSANVEGIKRIVFAVKTTSKWFSCRGDWAWPNGTWKIFELVNIAPNTWDIYIATAGNELTLKHSNVSQRILSANDNDTSKSILGFTCENDTCYVTNLRVLKDGKTKIAEFAVAGSEVVNDMNASFLQFEQVHKKTLPEGDIQNQTFIQTPANISNVTYAEFAFLTTNRPFSWAGWGGSLATNTWHIAKFTFNNDGTVNCQLCLLDGTVKYTYENKPSFAEAMPYYNYSGSNPAPDFYSTEIRAFIK